MKFLKTKKGKNNKGFSLIEVLLAIVILGLIATPIMQIFMTSYKVNNRSKRLLVAADISNNIAEGISSQCYDDTKTVGGTEVQGVKTYYENLPMGSSQPLYRNKFGETTPIPFGDLTIKSTSGDTVKYSFRNVQFKVYDAAAGAYVVAPAQDGEKPFNVLLTFKKIDSSNSFYYVNTKIEVFDQRSDGATVKEENASTSPLLETISTAIPNKFGDDR